MITENLQQLGEFSVRLKKDTPRRILDQLHKRGQIIITPRRVSARSNVLAVKDAYCGVYLGRSDDVEPVLRGVGLTWYLGDEDKKGYQFESLVLNHTYANAIRAALPPAIVEGTIHAVGVNPVVATLIWKNSREVIDFVNGTRDAGAEHRIRLTPTGPVLDAGTPEQLYGTEPKILAVRKGAPKSDVRLEHVMLSGAALDTDVNDWSSEVVVLPQGEGDTITPVRKQLVHTEVDMYGNPLEKTRVISFSEGSEGNADALASAHLAKFAEERVALRISLDEFYLQGKANVGVGEWIYVYDPQSGLVDQTNQVPYRGRKLPAKKLRIVTRTRPNGKGTYYRRADGTFLDLSDWALPDGWSGELQVGDFARSILGEASEAIPPRYTADPSVPAIPEFTEVLTGLYSDEAGNQRAQLVPSWGTPLNTDGSTIRDGAFYELGWRRNGETTYQYSAVSWGKNSQALRELANGVWYDLVIQAMDSANPPNVSGFSDPITVLAAPDTVAPSTPAPATVEAFEGGTIIAISRLGKATGGEFNLESDSAMVRYYLGDTADFAIDSGPAGNWYTQESIRRSHLQNGTPIVKMFQVEEPVGKWLRITIVDAAGNESDPSTSVLVTPGLITEQWIGSVNAGAITAGEIDASIEMTSAIFTGGLYRSAPDGQRVEIAEGEPDRVKMYSGHAQEAQPGYLYSTSSLSVPESLYVVLQSPRILSNLATAQLYAVSGSIDGTLSARTGFTVTDAAGVGKSQLVVSTVGVFAFMGADGSAPDGWFSISNSLAQFGFGTGVNARYLNADASAIHLVWKSGGRRLAIDTARVQIVGSDNVEKFKVTDTSIDAFRSLDMHGWDVISSTTLELMCTANDTRLAIGPIHAEVQVTNTGADNWHNFGANIITAATGGFAERSDERLKTDIEPLDIATCADLVRSTRPDRYRAKANLKREHWGFVAQKTPGIARRREIDLDGKVTESYSVTSMLAILWGAHIDADERLDKVERRLNDLEAA